MRSFAFALVLLTGSVTAADEGPAAEREVFVQPVTAALAPVLDDQYWPPGGQYRSFTRLVPVGFTWIDSGGGAGWTAEVTASWSHFEYVSDGEFAGHRTDTTTFLVAVGRMFLRDGLFWTPKVMVAATTAREARGSTRIRTPLEEGPLSEVGVKLAVGADVGMRVKLGRLRLTPIVGVQMGAGLRVADGRVFPTIIPTIPWPTDGVQYLSVVEPNLNLLRIGFAF